MRQLALDVAFVLGGLFGLGLGVTGGLGVGHFFLQLGDSDGAILRQLALDVALGDCGLAGLDFCMVRCTEHLLGLCLGLHSGIQVGQLLLQLGNRRFFGLVFLTQFVAFVGEVVTGLPVVVAAHAHGLQHEHLRGGRHHGLAPAQVGHQGLQLATQFSHFAAQFDAAFRQGDGGRGGGVHQGGWLQGR